LRHLDPDECVLGGLPHIDDAPDRSGALDLARNRIDGHAEMLCEKPIAHTVNARARF